jgi:hypothetical protein
LGFAAHAVDRGGCGLAEGLAAEQMGQCGGGGRRGREEQGRGRLGQEMGRLDPPCVMGVLRVAQ